MFDYGTDEIIGFDNRRIWPAQGNKIALVDADAIAYKVGFTTDPIEYAQHIREARGKDCPIFRDKINHASWYLNKWINQAECDAAILFITGKGNHRNKIAVSKPYKGQRVLDKPPFYHEIMEHLRVYHNARVSCNCEADDLISIRIWDYLKSFSKEILFSELHKSFHKYVVVSGDKDLGIIPGWHCHPDKGILHWVDPIGHFDPVWKEKEVTNYEQWPLFNGKAKNTLVCHVPMVYQGKMQLRCRGQLLVDTPKWEENYVWFIKNQSQDTLKSGKNKGKGKFKRVKVGKKIKNNLYKLKGYGLKFFYSQLITGDTVDNYSGIPMKGDAYAYKVLNNCTTEEQMHKEVLIAYVSYYRNERIATEKMLETGRLAHMQTHKGEIWEMLRPNKGTFPL